MKTGRKGKKAPAHRREAELQYARDEALRLRIEGKTLREIAAELGCCLSTAYNHVHDALENIPAENVKQLRQIESEKLDAREQQIRSVQSRILENLESKTSDLDVIASLAQRFFDGDRTLNKISERRARLLGIDKPARVEVGGPNGTPLTTVDIGSLSDAQLEQLSRGDTSALTGAGGLGAPAKSEGGSGSEGVSGEG